MSTLAKDTLGSLAAHVTLTSDDLQLNKHPADEDETAVRSPTSLALLPSQALVVVGFDSGEVQCYSMPDSGEEKRTLFDLL